MKLIESTNGQRQRYYFPHAQKYQQFVQHLSGKEYRIFAQRDYYYYFINLL